MLPVIDKNDHICTYLVYCADIDTDTAVSNAYILGSQNKQADVGRCLRDVIKDALQQAPPMPWPPTQDYLSTENVIPQQLNDLLRSVISGASNCKNDSREN